MPFVAAVSELAWIKSAMASAWVKSILSLKRHVLKIRLACRILPLRQHACLNKLSKTMGEP